MAERVRRLGVCWFEEPVSSDDLEGLRLSATAPRPAWTSPPASTATTRLLPPDARAGAVDVPPGRRHPLRRDHRLPAASRALPPRFGLPLSAHCAPALHAAACCAVPAFRHLEYFHDHDRIEHMLFDGALEPVGGALRPDLSRPGLGLEFKRQDAAALRGLSRATGRRPPRRDHADGPQRTADRRARIAALFVDARGARRTTCARRSSGEVRFDAGSRALYATDGSNYRQVPDRRRRSRATSTTWSRPSRSAAQHGAPILSRGGGTEPRRPVLQRRGRDRLLEVHEPRPRDRPRARGSRASQPGMRPRRPARRRPSEHHLTFGPDPVDARPLHARRDDRQQLLRRPLGHGPRHRPRPPTTSHELEILLYDGTRLTRRRHGEEELERIIRGGGRGRDLRAARATCATATPT